MIAYHFPPENAIGAARPFRFYKYLQRFGWTPVVITASPQDPARKLENVHYVPDPFLAKHRSTAWHAERAIRRFLVPGQNGMAWSRRVARFCESQLNRNIEGRVALYSTFPPLGTHLAALQVVRRHPLCWVADFRDPCFRDLYHSPGKKTVARRLRISIGTQIEQKIIEEPTIVIANTDAAAEEWKARFPRAAGRIQVIWNGFDGSDNLAAPALPPHTRKVLIHTGTMYGGRHTGPVLPSLDRLIRTNRLTADSIVLRFVGATDEGSLLPIDTALSAERQGWLEVTRTTVPRHRAIQMAREADGLFLVQPQSLTQVPGKLYEYIGIGRPILAFILRGSPIEDILQRCGVPNVCIYPEDTPDQVDQALLRFLQIPAGPWKANEWFLQTFDAVEQTRMLCSSIDEALARNSSER